MNVDRNRARARQEERERGGGDVAKHGDKNSAGAVPALRTIFVARDKNSADVEDRPADAAYAFTAL